MLVAAVGAFLVLPGVAGAAGEVATRRTGDGAPVKEVPQKTFDADHATRAAAERRLEDLSAQVVVSVPVIQQAEYAYGGVTWIDGLVRNPGPSFVTDVLVTVTYHDAGEQVLGSDTVWADCWMLLSMNVATFGIPYEPPAGTTNHHVSAEGVSTTDTRVYLTMAYLDGGWGPGGFGAERWYEVRLTNENAFTVVGAAPMMYENWIPDSTTIEEFWDAGAVLEFFQQRLAPGESVVVDVWALRSQPVEPGHFGAYLSGEALKAPPTDAVYRFYNRQTGTHFYTVDPGERDNVIANLGWLYSYEGPAYNAYRTEQVNTIPLYRFYNMDTGTHFYTADEAEAENVIINLDWLYEFEGEAYFICDSGGLATQSAYRFYNRRNGVHFYTATEHERNQVIANLGWLFTYEGPAFNVPIAIAAD